MEFNKIRCTILQIIVPKVCMSTRAAKRYTVVHIAIQHIHLPSYMVLKFKLCDSACCGKEEQ